MRTFRACISPRRVKLVVQARQIGIVRREAQGFFQSADAAAGGGLAPGVTLQVQQVLVLSHKGAAQAPERPGKKPLNAKHQKGCAG